MRKLEENYVEGKLIGTRKKYFENKKLCFAENYKDGELHGLREFFSEDGIREKLQLWNEGSLEPKAMLAEELKKLT